MADSEAHTVPLTARIEVELQKVLDSEAEIDSRRGAPVTRSQIVRVMLWEASEARKAARKTSACQAA